MSPLLALVDGEVQRATPASRGICPACEMPMRAKCGQIVVWHWAHVERQACDAYGPESAWHLRWKARMADAGARVEVIQRRDGECHIADVVLPGGFVLELAGTYHPADVIQQRERFYRRMAWLYDARPFIDRVEFWTKENGDQLFRFKQPPQSMLQHKRPVFWDCGDNWVRSIDRFWRWREERTYGALGGEGPTEEFVKEMMEA